MVCVCVVVVCLFNKRRSYPLSVLPQLAFQRAGTIVCVFVFIV